MHALKGFVNNNDPPATKMKNVRPGKGLDDMYEIEDYEDKISKHRKILWLFSLILFLGYLFCAGYAYNGAKTTYGKRPDTKWQHAFIYRRSGAR